MPLYQTKVSRSSTQYKNRNGPRTIVASHEKDLELSSQELIEHRFVIGVWTIPLPIHRTAKNLLGNLMVGIDEKGFRNTVYAI